MKKTLTAVACLLLFAALCEGFVLLQVSIDPGKLLAFLVSLSLILGVFVAFTHSAFVKELRRLALKSRWVAAGMPFLLLIPYFILAFGTQTFSFTAAGKLAAYIAAPTVALLPDRLRRSERVGWRDFAAMLALAVPVSANWLRGIWTWPHDLYFFRPLYSVCVGAYGFMILRELEGIGYKLLWRARDVVDGLANFIGFFLLAVPLGLALGFLHPHSAPVSDRLWLLGEFIFRYVGIYLTVAIPEELLFRGILQNFLVKSIAKGPHGLYGLLIASIVFGASHIHHPPVPNWRYAILAALAGLSYGNAYRTRQRLSASAFTHTLVDTAWHYWF